MNLGLLKVDVLGMSIWEFTPFVESRLRAAPAALREINADIVALQEIYRIRHRAFLAEALRDLYPYSFFTRRRRFVGLDNGLMLLARYPIEGAGFVPFEHNTLDERLMARKGFVHAIATVGGGAPVHLLNVHTTAGGVLHHPEALRTRQIRSRQIAQLLSAGGRVAGERGLILGDLNAGPGVSPDNYKQVLDAGYLDAWVLAPGQRSDNGGITWDIKNPLNKESPHATSPSQRIDYVFAHRELTHRFHVREARVVLSHPRVLVDGGAQVTVSDHYGLLVQLSSR